jgi:hypothetical protein
MLFEVTRMRTTIYLGLLLFLACSKLPAGTLEAVMKTVQGSMLKVDTTTGVKIGPATVTKADVDTSNGVIHVIDTVLLPA